MAQNDLNILVDLVVELVTNRNVHPNVIDQHITQALLKASKKYTKKPVLYNATYGYFNISNHFKTWLTSHDIEANMIDRVDAAEQMGTYSQDISMAFPDIIDLVTVIESTNIRCLFDHAFLITRATKKLKNVKANIAQIQQCLWKQEHLQSIINIEPSITDLDDECVNWEAYSTKELISFCNTYDLISVMEQYTDDLEEMHHANIWKDLPADIKHLLLAKRNEKGSVRSATFMEVYSEDKISAWKHQTYYNKDLMTLMSTSYYTDRVLYDYMMKQQMQCDVLQSKPLKDRVKETAGLLIASGKDCKLHIAYVPRFSRWYISYHGGLEKVEVEMGH
jgi:hypothetical protein